MPNRDIKEQRRQVAEADPATRRRMIAEQLSGNKAPIDTAAQKRVLDAQKDTPTPRPSTPGQQPGGNLRSGLKKLLSPKSNIEQGLAEQGE